MGSGNLKKLRNTLHKPNFRAIGEKVIFFFLFFNMTANEFIYRINPFFFIPSFALAVTPVVLAWIWILTGHWRYVHIYWDVIVFLLCAIALLVCAMLGNTFMEAIVFSSSFFVLITTCIFLYTRENLENVFKGLDYLCIVIGLIVCVYAISFLNISYLDMENAYMMIGYSLSLCVLILCEFARIKKKKIYYVFASVFSLVILAYGNRGAILVVLAYFIVSIFLHEMKPTKGQLFLFFGLVVCAFAVVISFDKLIIILVSVFDSLGISSRSIEKILKHSFSQSTGRNEIYEKAFDVIKRHPFDIREPGYMTTVYINARYVNANAHNILLELLVEYGCILGLLIFAVFVHKFIKSIRLLRKNVKIENAMAFCLLLQAFVQLSFSATFYSSNEFWLGLVLTGILSRRKYRVKERNIYKDGTLVETG